MNKKLKYLTKISLNKKIKTKWFLIANLIFAVLIIGLINIDSVIKFFGGDFNEPVNIYILDESDYHITDTFITIMKQYEEYTGIKSEVESVESEDKGYENISEDNNVLVIVMPDSENYMKAKIISNKEIDSVLYQTITSSLDSIKRDLALSYHGINESDMLKINQSIEIARELLESDGNSEADMEIIMGVVFPILFLPVFMLTMFLIQMIGAEINEEKSTKSMEIIISNVSAKTHFLSKLIAGNLFVLLQGILLIAYVIFALFIRFVFTKTIDVSAILASTGINITDTVRTFQFGGNLVVIAILTLVLIVLAFIGYSLMSAITASMTTNMEDYQQVQTPIVLISVVGFYLAMMAYMFKGSLFIRILSYVPFISTMLSPALFILNEISIIDVIISIGIMIVTIYILVRYGLRIYKVGILNYSSSNIWKKIVRASKNSDG